MVVHLLSISFFAIFVFILFTCSLSASSLLLCFFSIHLFLTSSLLTSFSSSSFSVLQSFCFPLSDFIDLSSVLPEFFHSFSFLYHSFFFLLLFSSSFLSSMSPSSFRYIPPTPPTHISLVIVGLCISFFLTHDLPAAMWRDLRVNTAG